MGETDLKVEYLIFIESKVPYLKKSEDFPKLLKMIDGVIIENGVVHYQGIKIYFKMNYMGNNEKFIDCQFSIRDTYNIEKFEIFLRNFRILCGKLCNEKSIEVLWNDIGFYYAKLVYPIIYKVENKMRNLITKFMYINVGHNWVSKNVPLEVEKSIKNTSNNNSFLDRLDFNQLTNFLFIEYSYKRKNELVNFIKNSDPNKKFEFKEFDKYIPKSNWDRFFKKHIEIEDSMFKKVWEEMYTYRCKVAHNNNLSRSDYNRIKTLAKKIEGWLNEAFKSLPLINLTEDEKLKILQGLPDSISYEEERIFSDILNKEKEEIKSTLIVRNLGLVVNIVKKYESATLDLEDLISVGTIGLIKGINTFKKDLNMGLIDYLSNSIELEVEKHFLGNLY